jgi:hypothetical protein
MAFACSAGIEVVEARVPVASAEAAVAWDDLPASVVCPAVICLEDLATDRADPA